MSNQRTIEIKGIEFKTANEAIQHCDAAGLDAAITVEGRIFAVKQAEADRIAAMGVYFAYLTERDGKIMTVPVN